MAEGATNDLFRTMNAGFVQAMYEQYLRDPASVDEEWRQLFENGGKGLEPIQEQAIGRGQSAMGHAPVDAQAAPVAHSPSPSASSPTPPGAPQPLRGAAARLVANMEQSLTVPTATSFRDVPAAVLDERRKALNAALAPQRFSYTHLIAWALVQAAKQIPVMVHAFGEADGGPARFVPDGVSLGLAVDVEKRDGSRALLVPVIKRADTMDFAAFHAAYEALVRKARAGQLLPDAFTGGGMTLTNPGTIGTVGSVPRLMAGQGSIIATGAIRDTGAGRVMTLTSTYDHRIIQGAESGMFLRYVDQLLQGEHGFYEGLFTSIGAGQQSVVSSRQLGVSATPADALRSVAAAMALVRAIRIHGHTAAQLDPLGRAPAPDPSLDLGPLGLTADVMAGIPAEVLRVYVPGPSLKDAYPRLLDVYCGTISYEIEHIGSNKERVWLRQVIEEGRHRPAMSAADRRRLLERLTAVDALERFLHKTYLGQKRFSIEGLDATVPMLDLMIELAGEAGARDLVIGMAHRGRLNVLAHVVNLPYETILAEFEGMGHDLPEDGTGDVKYHHGAEGVYTTPTGRRVTVTLVPNPSHLEAVNPVVEGRTRAEQTRRDARELRHDVNLAVPLLLHGDAAFAGQGVVAETFNLARLEGYSTGGTIHLIQNNQVGFTTDPRDARSTDYASDLAKGFDAPIVHVNADDPEACLAAVRLAILYRQEFHGDVVLDVVGYRRHGHNEADEPAYTQPALYELIRGHPPVRQRYAELLAAEGVVTPAAAGAEAEAAYRQLAQLQQQVKAHAASAPPREEHGISRQPSPEPDTAVSAERLLALNDQLLRVPDGFTVNPKLKKQLDRRRDTVGPGGGIEWAHAEALALASLLHDGTPVRLTGQDTERGTFSQRHLVLHDTLTGQRFAPIERLDGTPASIEVRNSPLSEYACLGFEYGYAAAAPETLVCWEAQFGDFANGAEVIVDQFIFAGLAKWGITSRLTLLLPHGYEGQGPEHSSARVERFVALGAEGNIRVANCTTPAQYFHLLRRQARHAELRPLVVFTPKSLLRLPAATSRLDDLAGGSFRSVLDDPAAADPGAVSRLVLCSGKIYYDLLASPGRAAARHVAIGRVELLYPLPRESLAVLIGRYPNVRELLWAQEEPRNMGARKFIVPELRKLVRAGVTVIEVSRPERASTAEGYPAAHAREQARIVREALGAG